MKTKLKNLKQLFHHCIEIGIQPEEKSRHQQFTSCGGRGNLTLICIFFETKYIVYFSAKF